MDPYALLGLPRSADSAEIKNSFRKLALEHHPDRWVPFAVEQPLTSARPEPGLQCRQAGASKQQQESAATKFADIKEAYETLADGEPRRAARPAALCHPCS